MRKKRKKRAALAEAEQTTIEASSEVSSKSKSKSKAKKGKGKGAKAKKGKAKGQNGKKAKSGADEKEAIADSTADPKESRDASAHDELDAGPTDIEAGEGDEQPREVDVGGEDDGNAEPVESEGEVESDGESEGDAELSGGEGPNDAPTQLEGERLARVIESLLFVADGPLTLNRMRHLTRVKSNQIIREAVEGLMTEYADRGIVIYKVSGGYQFRSHSSSSPWVQKLVVGKPVRLTRAQLDTLAIIAYRQPITRPEIDDIRGVDSGGTLRLLLERDLIRVLGKKEEPGRPLLYGTTNEFLEFFNLNDLRDLPTLREYSELTDESIAVVTDKLGEEALTEADAESDDGSLGAGNPEPEASESGSSLDQNVAATTHADHASIEDMVSAEKITPSEPEASELEASEPEASELEASEPEPSELEAPEPEPSEPSKLEASEPEAPEPSEPSDSFDQEEAATTEANDRESIEAVASAKAPLELEAQSEAEGPAVASGSTNTKTNPRTAESAGEPVADSTDQSGPNGDVVAEAALAQADETTDDLTIA